MAVEVSWRLMFRANDATGAERCLERTRKLLPAEVAGPPKPYWKIPELWEVSLLGPFCAPTATGIYELLRIADRLASGWYVQGPLVKDETLLVFEGVFDEKNGRSHMPGLSWASFSVGHFPPVSDADLHHP